jgi:hypothetical protein
VLTALLARNVSMHNLFVPASRKKSRKTTETDRKEARNKGERK